MVTEPQLLDLNGIMVVDLELVDLIVAVVTEPKLLNLIMGNLQRDEGTMVSRSVRFYRSQYT